METHNTIIKYGTVKGDVTSYNMAILTSDNHDTSSNSRIAAKLVANPYGFDAVITDPALADSFTNPHTL